MNGKLTVIEGLDGTGKSTQLDLLKSESDFKEFKFISFPDYNSLSGRIISQYLSGMIKENSNIYSTYSASSFYAIDRYLNYKNNWEDDIKNGKNIISARYVTSNAIYQMSKLPESEWEDFIHWLYDYEYNKLGLPTPDRVVYLEMPLSVSQELIKKRLSWKDNNDIHEINFQFMEACAKAANYLAKRDDWTIVKCFRNNKLCSKKELLIEISGIIKETVNA